VRAGAAIRSTALRRVRRRLVTVGRRGDRLVGAGEAGGFPSRRPVLLWGVVMANRKVEAQPENGTSAKAATKARQERFLAELAVTSNVVAAAAKAELNSCAIYKVRHRDPEFARRWDEALQHGYRHLESELLRHALGQAGGDAHSAPSTVEPELAFKLLTLGRRADPQGRRAGPRLKQPSEQEVLASLHRKLAAMEKKLERKR
jgi:hypothetical protein